MTCLPTASSGLTSRASLVQCLVYTRNRAASVPCCQLNEPSRLPRGHSTSSSLTHSRDDWRLARKQSGQGPENAVIPALRRQRQADCCVKALSHQAKPKSAKPSGAGSTGPKSSQWCVSVYGSFLMSTFRLARVDQQAAAWPCLVTGLRSPAVPLSLRSQPSRVFSVHIRLGATRARCPVLGAPSSASLAGTPGLQTPLKPVELHGLPPHSGQGC